ncbi:hypothetical protein Tco_1154516 [Tanacetum coccineum]
MTIWSNAKSLEKEIEELASEQGLVPQGQKASDYDNSDPEPPRQNVVPSAEKPDSSHQGLEFLFSPLLEEYYNPTHDQAEENNNDQAPNASFQEAEFVNPFCTRVQEIDLEMCKFRPAHRSDCISHKARLVLKVMLVRGVLILKNLLLQMLRLEACSDYLLPSAVTKSFPIYSDWSCDNGIFLMVPLKEKVLVHSQKGFLNHSIPEKVYLLRKGFVWIKANSKSQYDELATS